MSGVRGFLRASWNHVSPLTRLDRELFHFLSNLTRKMARCKQKANAKKIRTDSSPDKENKNKAYRSTSGYLALTCYLGHRRLQPNSASNPASNPAILAIVLGL